MAIFFKKKEEIEALQFDGTFESVKSIVKLIKNQYDGIKRPITISIAIDGGIESITLPNQYGPEMNVSIGDYVSVTDGIIDVIDGKVINTKYEIDTVATLERDQDSFRMK